MTDTSNYTPWTEVFQEWLKDPVFVRALEEYAPVQRDRVAERTRCEAEIPGYKEERETL